MSETTETKPKSTSHSNKSQQSERLSCRIPNDLVKLVFESVENKTEITVKALRQYADKTNQELLDFLIIKFVELGLEFDIPDKLETRLLERIAQLKAQQQKEGK